MTALVVVIPFLIYLADGARLALKRDRRLCVACGYDLRASPCYCPECGRRVGHSRENQPVEWTGPAERSLAS